MGFLKKLFSNKTDETPPPYRRLTAPVLLPPRREIRRVVRAPLVQRPPPEPEQEILPLGDSNPYLNLITDPKKKFKLCSSRYEAMISGEKHPHNQYAYDVQTRSTHVPRGDILIGVNFSNYAVGDRFQVSWRMTYDYRRTILVDILLTEENINDTFQPIGDKYNIPMMLLIRNNLCIIKKDGTSLDKPVTLTYLQLPFSEDRQIFLRTSNMICVSNGRGPLYIRGGDISYMKKEDDDCSRGASEIHIEMLHRELDELKRVILKNPHIVWD